MVYKIAKWKNIHHLPVVNNEQSIVGVITTKILNDLKDKDDSLPEAIFTKDVMSRSVVMVTSDTSIEEAGSVIERQNVNCLLVMENKHLVGIFNKQLIP